MGTSRGLVIEQEQLISVYTTEEYDPTPSPAIDVGHPQGIGGLREPLPHFLLFPPSVPT